MALRDDILRLLEARDRVAPDGANARLTWLMAALELLLRAELARQNKEGGHGT